MDKILRPNQPGWITTSMLKNQYQYKMSRNWHIFPSVKISGFPPDFKPNKFWHSYPTQTQNWIAAITHLSPREIVQPMHTALQG